MRHMRNWMTDITIIENLVSLEIGLAKPQAGGFY